MALRLILGRAGSGKTHLCVSEVRQALQEANGEGPTLFMLVPEQATFQTERALLAEGLPGYTRCQVISFQRLAFRVLSETGGMGRPPVGVTGKLMLLREITLDLRSSLRAFGRASHHAGFLRKLAGALTEMHTYCVEPAALRHQLEALESAGEGESALAAKLHDLALIGTAYQERLTARFVDPDQYLNQAAKQLGAWEAMRGAHVWIDGFAGFTPQELLVLEAIFRRAAMVNVALCVDPDLGERIASERFVPVEADDLFQPTAETLQVMLATANRLGVPITTPVLLKQIHRFTHPFLQALERSFAEPAGEANRQPESRSPNRAVPSPPPPIRVQLVPNRLEEVRMVAGEIRRLAYECGYRYREIGIVVRDLGPYRDLVAEVFSEAGIPYFIDQRRPIGHHPLVDLLRSALDVVMSGWQLEAVLRCLKTDLFPLGRDLADELENYALAHGLSGSAWRRSEPWAYWRTHELSDDAKDQGGAQVAAALARINRGREALCEPLRRLDKALRTPGLTVQGACTALYALLEDLQVGQTLAQWAEAAEVAGELEVAAEHQAVGPAVVALFDEMVEVLATSPIGLGEFASLLGVGLDGIRLGLIPPALDQVLVGAIDRSRNPNLRAVFVLGVAQREFPRLLPEDQVFSDLEREWLALAGCRLAPPASTRMIRERFLGYIAVTRASEALWVSCPLADESGRAVKPSSLFHEVAALAEAMGAALQPGQATGVIPGEIQTEDQRGLHKGLRDAFRPVEAATVVARAARSYWEQLDPPHDAMRLVLAVYQLLQSRPDWAEAARPAFVGLHPEPISRRVLPETVARLLGADRALSVSRLERFAACPFQHFAADLLSLKPREQFTLEPSDWGRVYHEVLRAFVAQLKDSGRLWESLTDEELAQVASDLCAAIVPRLRNEIFMSSARYRFFATQLERIMTQALQTLAEHARRGRFRPVAVEQDFGMGPGGWPPYPVPGTSLSLRGRIDRVDLAERNGVPFVRIIDYKSGAQRLSLTELFHGLSLQLLTYLAVARANGAALGVEAPSPAGALYFRIFDPMLRDLGHDDPAERLRQKLRARRMQGMVLAAPEVMQLMDERVSGELVPGRLTKDGRPYSDPLVVSESRLERALHVLHNRLTSLGRALLQGDAEASPYRLGQDTACGRCEFRAVCRFDPRTPHDRYRTLEKRDNRRAWDWLMQEGGNGDASLDAGTASGD